MTDVEGTGGGGGDDDQCFISPETIDLLTNGFLSILQPEVLRVDKSLNELT